MKRLNGYRMRMVLVGIVAVIVFGGGRTRADFVWAQKADMPITRYQHSASIVAGKIYVIGGWYAIGEWNPQWEALTKVDEYDPATDTWTRKADMPTARGFTSTCVVNERIYAMDGDVMDWDAVDGDAEAEPISIVEVYDPATDTWTQQTELPTKRWQFTTSVVDGIIHVIGGYMPSISRRTGLVEAYDPTTDTWTRKTDMPTTKTYTSSCVVDGKIYVIGGAWTRKVVEAYDPATDTWTAKSPMPTPRYLLDTCVVGGKIYTFGGYYHSISGPIYATVEVYDPQTDTWTKGVDIPTTMAGMSTSVVDGKIYVIGGTVATHPGEHWVLTSAVYANEPIVDFNGDGIVDAADMVIMVDHWGTDERLCDVAPLPFGDGIVDVEDLKVLAEHLFDDYRELAQWKLDETEGSIAYDSVGGHDGILYGEPIWQPTGGQVCGALELDGIDDYVETDFVLDPAEGAFSVFAWIQGGAPGHAIISQINGDGAGETWLGTDTISGNLMTGLVPEKIGWVTPQPLVSESVITDMQWHHVGFVWDGSYRALYVDGIDVAKDNYAQNPLNSSEGGLYIGASKDLEAGTFFSGLIDDVRIYTQALTAEEIAALSQ